MYPQQMTEEERLIRAIMSSNRADRYGPMGTPMTMGTQVQNHLGQAPTAQQLGSPQAPGMPGEQPDPYNVRSAKDFSPEAAEIKDQREYANMLRGRKMPKGQEVGPLDVYVGPNWGETLEGAGGKLLGGYLSGKANQASGRLSKAMEEDAAAVSESQADLAKYKERTRIDEADEARAFTTSERVAAEEARASQARQKAEAEEARRVKDKRQAILTEGGQEIQEEADRRRDRWDDQKDDNRDAQQARDLAILKDDLKDDASTTVGEDGLTGEQSAAIDRLGGQRERDAARTYVNSIKTIDGLARKAEKMIEDGKSWSSFSKSAGAEAAGALPIIGESARGWAKDAMYDEDEAQMRQDILTGYTEFRRSLTGANLTAIERFIEEDNDPLQEGISSEESFRRVMRLRDHMEGKLNTMKIPHDFGRDEGGGKEDDSDGAEPENPSVPGSIITSGKFQGMTQGDDGKVYDEDGKAVARWR